MFDRASRAGGASGSKPMYESGLTLAELQEVGREVGLAPARVAEAAAALERAPEAVPRRTLLGVPLSVGRIVALPRAPTDHEWSQGNLHAFIEPTETGYRLRMGTLKESANAALAAGVFGLGFALFLAAILMTKGRVDEILGAPFLIFALVGAAAIGSNFLTLPQWARERERQMEHIGGHATALLAGGRSGEESGT